jgi:FkbM family methyltransferase
MKQINIRTQTPDEPLAIMTGGSRGFDRFVSYAQNLEDVMLWRALKPFSPGFYIDLGAGEPVADSVTKAFYERGWRGINVEPMPDTFGRLQAARPRDINLQLAVDNFRGRRTYFSVDGGGGLSTGQPFLASAYTKAGRKVSEIEVEVDTLENICKTYVTQEIHFLKVDVEGGEHLVLEGADLLTYRPWIIILESPEAAENPVAPAWHTKVARAGYHYAYYDGLNRFYIANEKRDLLAPSFVSPPCWFDNYVQRSYVELEENIGMLSARCAEFGDMATTRQAAEERARALDHEIQEADSRERELRQVLNGLKSELENCYQQLYEDSRRIGWLSAQRQRLVTEVSEKQRGVDRLQQTVDHLQQNVDRLQHAIRLMEGSRSWRLVRPVRALAFRARKLRGRRAGP